MTRPDIERLRRDGAVTWAQAEELMDYIEALEAKLAKILARAKSARDMLEKEAKP